MEKVGERKSQSEIEMRDKNSNSGNNDQNQTMYILKSLKQDMHAVFPFSSGI